MAEQPTDSFTEWTTAVTRILWHRFAITLDDLPDMNTRDAFESGVTPQAFYDNDVMNALREEFGPFVDAFNHD